jgi:hypothetical protein
MRASTASSTAASPAIRRDWQRSQALTSRERCSDGSAELSAFALAEEAHRQLGVLQNKLAERPSCSAATCSPEAANLAAVEERLRKVGYDEARRRFLRTRDRAFRCDHGAAARTGAAGPRHLEAQVAGDREPAAHRRRLRERARHDRLRADVAVTHRAAAARGLDAHCVIKRARDTLRDRFLPRPTRQLRIPRTQAERQPGSTGRAEQSIFSDLHYVRSPRGAGDDHRNRNPRYPGN